MRRAYSDEPKVGQLGINYNHTKELALTRSKSVNFAGEIISSVSVLTQRKRKDQPCFKFNRSGNKESSSQEALSLSQDLPQDSPSFQESLEEENQSLVS